MAVRRSEIVDDSRSGFYHCCDRCVRRLALLRSPDDRRREWLVDRLKVLANSYAIDTVSIGVMENHMHTIVRTLPELVETWSDREVAYRWILLHPNRTRRRRMGIDPDAPPQEIEIALNLDEPGRIDVLRARLSSVSYFMKDFKEPIARRANAEDGAEGHFWQSRFRCKPLLDDRALLCCATYVDMNPVAAGMADDPLTVPFTSVQEHLRRLMIEGERLRPIGESGTAGSDRESTLRRLDETELAPAIPCRREPHLVEEEAAEGETANEEMSTEEVGGNVDPPDPTSVDAPTNGSASVVEPDGAAASIDADSGGSPHPVRPPRRPIPPLAVLGMSLGAYLRRLAAAAQVAAARLRSTPDDERRPGDPADRGPGVGNLAQAILDGVDRSMESLVTLLLDARFWGTAIGSTTSLQQEALRRNRHRIVCSLR